MTVTLNVGDNWSEKEIEIYYDEGEYSFDFRPIDDSYSPLLINNLNLSVNCNGLLLGVWGLCPHSQWQTSSNTPPEAEKRDLFIKPECLEELAVSIRINKINWGTYFNPKERWLCVGQPNALGVAIEFVPDTIAVLSESSEIVSLWIKVN